MNTPSRCVVAMFLACLLSAPVLLSQSATALFEQGLIKENAEGTLNEAIAIFSRIAGDTTADAAIRAKAQLHVGICYEKLGNAQARGAYERVIADFPQQDSEVAAARQRLARLATVSAAEAPRPTFRRIIIPGGISAGAQLSPDGSRLATVADGDVWVVKLQGHVAPEIAGGPERLSQGAGASWVGVAWSGDGKWIAYNDAKVPTAAMYVLSASGGTARKVPRAEPLFAGVNWSLGLSSDGQRLAHSTVLDGRSVLQIASVATGETIIRFADPDAIEPRFSPDGGRVAYVKYKQWPSDLTSELRVVRLADSSDIPVAASRFVRSPAWSPDGMMLVFLSQPDANDPRAQEISIARLPQAGAPAGEPTTIRPPRITMSLAGWTADNRIGLICMSPLHNAIYSVPVSGGKATQVTPDNEGVFLPQWSPDGERIYFRWAMGDIAFVPARGGGVTVVSRGADVIETLPGGGNHISPDGTRMVFSGVKKGDKGVHLWIIPVAGGEAVRLPMTPDLNAWQPRWSPDGKWIAFESERDLPGERKLDENIFIVSSQGGEPRQLTSHTDCYCELEAWSPAGDSIAYACSDKVLRVIPAGGGAPRIVVKDDGLESHQGSLAWSSDGSRLMYTARRRMWTVPASGGEPTAIATNLDGDILQFALSPDGKTIAFNAPSGGDTELWLMEDFLPLIAKRR
jgi:Tol biopolymer transport system component